MKVLIVVPTISLLYQWKNEIQKSLNIKEETIGIIGDGKHNEKDITIAVVNSIRYEFLKAKLLIIDEMHRYGSTENFRFLQTGQFDKILGLTATVKRQDGAHKDLFKHAPLIFKFGQKEAIDSELLSKFVLINKKIVLNPEENASFTQADNFIKQNFKIFDNKFQEVQAGIYGGGPTAAIAADLMRAFNRRRKVLLHAKDKVNEACNIIETEKKKTIVFCEYIMTADTIVKQLKKRGISAAKYHSKMKNGEKAQMLEDFKSSAYTVMVAVKALDEGTNVPDCEMEIIVAGTGVTRQMVQRLGRGLRTSEGKGHVKVYQLYIADTQDEKWMRKRNVTLSKNASEVRWE